MPRKVFRTRFAFLFVVLALAAFAGVKFVSHARKSGPAAPAATTVTDTQTDNVAGNTVNNTLQVGEKDEGTVTVSVSGSAQAFTNVSIPLDSHLTLDTTFGNGSGFTVSPLVPAKTFNVIGNVEIQPVVANGVLAGAIDP